CAGLSLRLLRRYPKVSFSVRRTRIGRVKLGHARQYSCAAGESRTQFNQRSFLRIPDEACTVLQTFMIGVTHLASILALVNH
ncbi:MAG: hypothetical protein V3T23_10680, partial [Nitrososphaerales archaeon]